MITAFKKKLINQMLITFTYLLPSDSLNSVLKITFSLFPVQDVGKTKNLWKKTFEEHQQLSNGPE